VDTLLVYSPTGGTEDDVRRARAYLERGSKERPYDPMVWLHLGQFQAFLAPSFLSDEKEIEAWRREGALAIAHAVELGAEPDRALAASTILNKAGEHEAAVRSLERAYAIAPEGSDARLQIMLKLQKLNAGFEAEQSIAVVERDRKAWYPHLTRGQALLVGPHRKTAACAGPLSYDQARCPTDWDDAIQHQR
jgi:tetratricopeptide (TPR) repeat protein